MYVCKAPKVSKYMDIHFCPSPGLTSDSLPAKPNVLNYVCTCNLFKALVANEKFQARVKS